MTEFDKTVIVLLCQLEEVSFDPSRYTLIFPREKNQAIIANLLIEDIVVEESGLVNSEIDMFNLPWTFFFDEPDFLIRVNRHSWTKPLFILKEEIFYDCQNETTFLNLKEANNYFLISNNYYSYQFLDFLKSQDLVASSAFYFVDYFSWDSRHVVLTSLKKNGKVEFILPNEGINIRENIGLRQALLDFKEAFNDHNKHFPKFLKSELIEVLSKVDRKKRMEELLRNLNHIVYVASQSFEIYLQDLSLENLKNDFFEHKNKYFIQLREVLSKLTNQIIGLPLAIAASVFSTYKVSDSVLTLLVILAVFMLYTFYSVFLLKIQKEDLIDVKTNFKLEFQVLAENQFFKKFDKELDMFLKAKSNLMARINSLLSAIDLYFFFFTASTCLFVVYLLVQLKISTSGIAISTCIIFLGMFVVFRLTQTLRGD